MRKRILWVSDVPCFSESNVADHNFMKLMSLVPDSLSAPGTVTVMNIAHDDYCNIHKHGLCNCRPNITIWDPFTDRTLFVLRWYGDWIHIRVA
ncbi:MAG TPA: hypothetical protein VMJ64_09085 [Anaerolineales bacterium]|nr:hypothetical protein [Anaerolineales bacterium]